MKRLFAILVCSGFLVKALTAAACPHVSEPFEGDGPIIRATVWSDLKSQTPRQSVDVELVSSSGNIVWIGRTDKQGGFEARGLAPDLYTLRVAEWGSLGIKLVPQRYFGSGGQAVFWAIRALWKPLLVRVRVHELA